MLIFRAQPHIPDRGAAQHDPKDGGPAPALGRAEEPPQVHGRPGAPRRRAEARPPRRQQDGAALGLVAAVGGPARRRLCGPLSHYALLLVRQGPNSMEKKFSSAPGRINF